MSGMEQDNGALLDKKGWHDEGEELVARAIEHDTQVSALFVDVNNFKEINDSLGHDVGDQVIADIELIVESVTTNFLLGGHIGGDEFAIIGEIDEDEASIVKELLKERFNAWLDLPEQAGIKALDVGLAIGAATRKEDEGFTELVTNADTDMYKDKLDQLPELTDEQFATLSEARLALQAVGLRLRDIEKYRRRLEQPS